MSVYSVLTQEQSKHKMWEIISAVNSRQGLDDVIDDLIIYEDVVDQKHVEKLQRIYDRICFIVEKYLNNREKLIFYLYINEKKNVAQIQKICSFGCWFTAYSHLVRVFKLIKIYYKYECIDKDKLDKQINNNFNISEKKIIECLKTRMSYPEISKEMKSYYRKTYYDCQDVLKKLESECPEFYRFITELRKFKRLNDFDIQIFNN